MIRLVVVPLCTWLLKLVSFPNILMVSSFQAYRVSQLGARLAITGQCQTGTQTPHREYYIRWSQETLMSTDRRITEVRPIQVYSHSCFIFINLIFTIKLFVSGTVRNLYQQNTPLYCHSFLFSLLTQVSAKKFL